MSGKLLSPLALGEIAAHAGGQGRALDQPGHLLIVEPIDADRFTLTSNTAEQGAMRDAGKPQPVLERDNRAGGVGRTAADLDLAPASLAAQCHKNTFVEHLDPAAAIFGLIAGKIEADDF